MTDPAQARADRWLYGAAAVAALLAGLVAIWGARDDEAPPAEAADPAPPTEDRAPLPGAIVFEDAGPSRARVGPDFVPELPEVPDLAPEPPTPPPTRDDPRMEQLGAEMRLLSRARDLLADHPAEALGVRVDVTAATHTTDGLLDALEEHLRTDRSHQP